MSLIGYLALFISGILAGVIGGLLGTGGCVLMMPVVRFGFAFPAALAVGTTLTAVVFTAAAGAIKHISIGNVDKNTAFWVGIFGVLGVIIGSFLSSAVWSTHRFDRRFSLHLGRITYAI